MIRKNFRHNEKNYTASVKKETFNFFFDVHDANNMLVHRVYIATDDVITDYANQNGLNVDDVISEFLDNAIKEFIRQEDNPLFVSLGASKKGAV